MKSDPSSRRLEGAILRTIAYSDVFHYPLRESEVHRYLDTVAATPSEVDSVLQRMAGSAICTEDDMVALAGRDALFAVRRKRRHEAARLWPAARRWARIIGRLPLIRMVSLTGALAVNNVERSADIDYLIVTEPGRVWLCRAMIVQMVRAARLTGVVLCPNWLLSADALVLEERSLFAARELTQMVPLTGFDFYRRMRRLNPWAQCLLPNAAGPPVAIADEDRRSGAVVRVSERLLLSRAGARVDRWDRQRKTSQIVRENPSSPEVVLDKHQCKGHVNAHGERIRRAYADRLTALGLDPEEPDRPDCS